ncbi:MAG TPA: S-layer homology domain-containing protein [Thermodesulfobacteriota bacterium]|nr:S-layer homology domain-containing protein [Thermodesulfobacteriota bacterium]
MERRGTFLFFMALLILVVVAAMVSSCAAPPRKPEAALDTPEHHVFSGNKLMDKGDYIGAQREFVLAMQLDKKYSPAYVGLGLAFAYEKDFEKAHENIKKGKSLAEKKEDKVNACVGMIRLYSLERKEKWLDKAEDEFEEAVKIDPKSSAAYFYMGKAYKYGYNFDKAGERFKKVLDLNDKFLVEADNEWKVVQKVQRAAPGSMIGKKIALIEEISRADVAALFIQELLLEKLYEKRTPKQFDTSYQAPASAQKFEADKIVKAEPATDIQSHVLRIDIETVLRLGVRGLEPSPDHKFFPDQKINRAAYAMMIEDILIKVSGDEKLATKFIGSKSPFPDLRSDLPYFNAVMVVTSRGVMEAKDLTTGEFAPQDTVSGADALLIIRKLKDELRFF